MCNFVIRPIKSYATIDLKAYNDATKQWEDVKRGTAIVPKFVFGSVVYYDGDDGAERTINLDDYVHVFTANQEDVKKVKDEESKWFKAKKSEDK